MNIEAIFRNTAKLVSDNAPVILTGTAVAGTISTAIFAGKAAYEQGVEEAAHGAHEDPKQRFKEQAPRYIPAAVLGSLTVTSIVLAHSVNTRRQAALVSAYTVVDKAFADYREKITETIGENHEGKVRDQLAKEQLEKNPVVGNEVIITGGGDQLFYDSLTGRYFQTDMETVRKAQNDVNARVISDMYASQNEFYALIGLGPSQVGEEFGWTTDRFMDIEFSTHLSPDGKPCVSMNYIPSPVRNYWRMTK